MLAELSDSSLVGRPDVLWEAAELHICELDKTYVGQPALEALALTLAVHVHELSECLNITYPCSFCLRLQLNPLCQSGSVLQVCELYKFGLVKFSEATDF